MNKKLKLVILGAGESGVGTAILGKKEGFEVFVSDYGKIKNCYKIHLDISLGGCYPFACPNGGVV